jgi:EpsI family protein
MTVRLLPALLILANMIGAPVLAHLIRPTVRIADQGPKVDLEAMIPKQFGDWRMVNEGAAIITDPQQAATLERIYNQTLARTYVDSKGYRVMLSIAYGGDQSDSMQVHKPEICYPAQGFVVMEKTQGIVGIQAGSLPATRLVASLGSRREPITYWTTIGNQVVVTGLQKKLVEMKYAFTGKIPDGLLFRVSSISDDTISAFQQQEQFVNQLLKAVPPEHWQRLTGMTPLTRAAVVR